MLNMLLRKCSIKKAQKNKHAPLVGIMVKHYNQAQWMTDEVMTAIIKRDTFKAEGNFDRWKFLGRTS